MSKKLKTVLLYLAPLAYVLIGLVIIYYIVHSGKWPAGDDVMYHIYRGEKLYQSIRQGHWWIALDTTWYNGVEILRYWSPLPAYLMAFCIFLAHGSSMHGYLVFTFFMYLLSAFSWYLIGLKKNRPIAGFVLGLLWFFIPQNLSYYFASGNLAGMSGILTTLPWFICYLNTYMDDPNNKHLIGLALSSAIMCLCHSGFGLLAMLAALFYLIFRKLFNRQGRNSLKALTVVVLGFMLTGVWFIASRKGVSATNYTEQLKASFQPLLTTLNPFDRLTTEFAHYYFSLAAFVIAILGIFFASKKSRPGFLTTVFIALATSLSAYQVIKVLPGSTMLWMSRMISAAIAIAFYSFLEWPSLKKPLQTICLIALALDCGLSNSLIYGYRNNRSVTSRFTKTSKETLLTNAKAITKQRLALIDASSLAATGAYLASSYKKTTPTTFGAGYEAAVTRENITLLNRAANDGDYLYLFDRALELGNDTVDIQISQLKSSLDREAVTAAAKKVGYRLVASNDAYLLYHLNVKGNFGIKTTYTGIAIGTNASQLALQFPALNTGDDTDLNDYTYDQLKNYKIIYLSGFTMTDSESAEKMILKLSQNGVRIVIDADGIPENKNTRIRSFLGVTCPTIRFQNGYPEMDTRLGHLNLDLFPKGSETWNTVYLNGLKDSWGTIKDQKLKLSFIGTGKNKNLVYIGLNLTYFYSLTNDSSAGKLLSYALNLDSSAVPKREIVNLRIKETVTSLTIESPADNVNTTISYHDIFKANKHVSEHHNLTFVNKGTTIIRYRNPYLLPGLAVTLIGLAGLVFMILKNRKGESS